MFVQPLAQYTLLWITGDGLLVLSPNGGFQTEDSWLWTPGCELTARGCGFLPVDSWLRTPGCGLLALGS